MKSMDNICKGCKEHERHVEKPEEHNECEGYKRKHVNCPCQCCLVKPICDDVCDKYKNEWEVFSMPDTVNMDKLCEGCVLYELYFKESDDCFICTGYLIKDVDCPCINYLLKMICDKVCENLTKTLWWYNYVRKRKEKNGRGNYESI